MKITIADLRSQVNIFLLAKGLNEADAQTMTSLVIEQELVGNRFSAVGELAHLIKNHTDAKEDIVVSKPAATLIKGNGRMAYLITSDHLDEAIARATKQGIYALGVYDSTYNDFFDVYCRRVAARDCVAIILENGGPQGVVPFGGRSDVTGTNPLAYGIPTHGNPIVFDAAMAIHAYGMIGVAKARGERLPDNSYVDINGDVTTDPEVAHAVLPFGGFKGFAINILADVLSGALVRGRCGLDQPADSERHFGTIIIIIDPAAFGDMNDFKDSTTKLVTDIMAVAPVDPQHPVRVPGMRGAERRESSMKTGEIEIDDQDWQKFQAEFPTR